jgi:hypothetical protein
MQVMQPHRQIVVKTFSERRFGFWFCNSFGECVVPAVLDGGPIGGNPPATKRLTFPYLLKWEKSNVDNDEQQLPVHRKQGLWRG